MISTPILTPSPKRARLLVTIDSEEEFDWSGFEADDHQVGRPDDIERLQRLCEDFGARPIYFLTYPLIVDKHTSAYFRGLKRRGAADLGVHVHAWNTPPIGAYETPAYSWQGNLPAEIHALKIKSIVDAFQDAFGESPIAHRAGRYGITPRAYSELAAIGLDYDFSPSPGFDFSADGGPDFTGMSNHPFTIENDSGRVRVTPVCGAWALRGGRMFLSQKGEPGFAGKRRTLPRSLAAPLRLTCEGARFGEMTELTRRLLADRTPVLTFSIHSTTMTPGGNPYAHHSAAVNAALLMTRRYLEWFKNDLRGEIIDLDELRRLYAHSEDVNLNPRLSLAS